MEFPKVRYNLGVAVYPVLPYVAQTAFHVGLAFEKFAALINEISLKSFENVDTAVGPFCIGKPIEQGMPLGYGLFRIRQGLARVRQGLVRIRQGFPIGRAHG